MIEPSISEENGTAQESPVTKKKSRKIKQRKRKPKESPVTQPPPSHDSDTQTSPHYRTKATQTDDELLEKTTVSTGTQTQSVSVWNESTQTPGTRFARDLPSASPAQVVPSQALEQGPDQDPEPDPSGQLSQEESPPCPSGSPEQPLDNHPQPTSKRDLKRDENMLYVLCWNIDGLDLEDVEERWPSLLRYIMRIRADVVLLQELIAPMAEGLEKSRIMKDYELIVGNTSGYFTGMLLLRSRVKLLQSTVVNYPTTEMGRNLLTAQLSFSGHQLWVMTSHLESCKDSSQERMNQLRRVWKRMREAPDDHTVIFGGDTNLRDREVKWLGGVPEGISDVWELLGQPEDCKFTWDTVTNNNKDLPFPARLRFDRVYIRPGKEGSKVTPASMKLVGQDRLKCGRFTSDHWGILCKFSMESQLSSNEI